MILLCYRLGDHLHFKYLFQYIALNIRNAAKCKQKATRSNLLTDEAFAFCLQASLLLSFRIASIFDLGGNCFRCFFPLLLTKSRSSLIVISEWFLRFSKRTNANSIIAQATNPRDTKM